MKWTETFTEQSQPLGPSFPLGFTPQVLQHSALPCKTLSSGPKVARLSEGMKKAPQGDYSTSKQNALPTVGNSRPHHPESTQVCLLSLLLRTIWTTFWHYCRGRSEQPGSRLPSLTSAESDEVCLLSLLLRTIWTARSVHLKMSQCRASGVVMPVANLYAKDCTMF